MKFIEKQKILLILLIALSIYAIVFSFQQWQAENLYSIEKSVLEKSLATGLPSRVELESLQRAKGLSNGLYTYNMLLGKYYLYRLALQEKDSPKRIDAWKMARIEFIGALKQNPSYVESLVHLAWIDFSLGRIFPGLKLLENALRLSNHNYFIHVYYGVAIINFIHKFPKELANIYMFRAEEEIQNGIGINPQMSRNLTVVNSLFTFQMIQGNIPLAIKELEKVRSIRVSTLDFHLKLASLYLRAGRDRAGIQKYFQLTRLIKGNIKKSRNIDLVLTAKQRKKYNDLIIKSLVKDLKKYPVKHLNRFFLAKLYFENQLYKRAILELNLVLRTKSNFAAAYFLRGQTYEAMGNFDAAYNDYENTFKYNRNHKLAMKKITEMIRKRLR